MRLSLFFFLNLVAFVILLIVHPHAKAASEWLVSENDKHLITSASDKSSKILRS